MTRIRLNGASVFDPHEGAFEIRSVMIQESRFVADDDPVGPEASWDDRDLTGFSILPGLIDCHSHVALPDVSFEEQLTEPPSLMLLRAIPGLRATLASGITTVRDAAYADVGLKRAIDLGLVEGPRLQISLIQICPSGGPNDWRSPSGRPFVLGNPSIPSPVAEGVDGLRSKVRELVHFGADVIKVFATGTFAAPRDGAKRVLYSDDELRAIVAQARALDVRVMAHAHGAEGVKAAARAGVDSVEHAFYLDDEAIAVMAEARTTLVPTLFAGFEMVEEATAKEDGHELERLQAVARGHSEAVGRAFAAGVPIAMGTDTAGAAHGRNLEELRLMVDAGLPPVEALRSATLRAAGLLGMTDDIGAVEPGKRADLVVVEGDPLAFADLGSRVRAVMKDGRLVSGELPRASGAAADRDGPRSSREPARSARPV
jgi:imidazolonepropionase-like amidohydrolase